MLKFEQLEELERKLKYHCDYQFVQSFFVSTNMRAHRSNRQIEAREYRLKEQAANYLAEYKSNARPMHILSSEFISCELEYLNLDYARIPIVYSYFLDLMDPKYLAYNDRYNSAFYERAIAGSIDYLGFTDYERPRRYAEIAFHFDVSAVILPVQRSRFAGLYEADCDYLDIEFGVFKRRIRALLTIFEGYACAERWRFLVARFSCLIAPFCFLYDDDVELVKVFSGLYEHCFRRLREVESLCYLIYLTYEFVRLADPALLVFLKHQHLSLESIVVPWFIAGFSGCIPLRETLYLWDNVFVANRIEYFAAAAAALLLFKSETVRCFETHADILVYLNENSGVQLFPLLKSTLGPIMAQITE